MSKSKRHTILVVDDEPDVVKSVQDLLRYDYKVLGATRAKDAIAQMDSNEIHLVMSDQRMPEMSGVEFLRQVRERHPDAIRLLFTGYADIRAVVDAINQGNVYRYITKPWDPEELQGIIREAVERYDIFAERKRLVVELEEKNAELEKVNAALRESDGLKTAFIHVASHELRTPLAILQGLTDLATRTPNVPQPLGNWLEQLRKATGRMSHLVNQIVKMLESGQFERPLESAPAQLSELLDEAASDVQTFVDVRNQALERDWPPDLGAAVVDRAKLRDSLNHLLLNAIKFTPDGGRLTLSARPEGDDTILLSVHDTGVGIDPAALPRLGDRFFTGFDVSRHSSGHFEYGRRGLGLGLSVVKAFVEMQGGVLKVESELGKGTTFTIRLPRRPAESAEGAPPVPATAAESAQ